METIIISDDGLTAKAKNPFDTQYSRFGEAFCEWEAHNPSYPLTEKGEAGKEVFARLLYQLYDHDIEQWQDGNYSDEVSWEVFNKMWRTARKAWKVVSNKDNQ